MKRIKYWIRNHFGFSQKETNGFVILVMLMIIMLFAPMVYKQVSHTYYDNYEADKKILDSLVSRMERKNEKTFLATSTRETTINYFYFNPNTASNEDLAKIFGKYFSKRIVSYRSKGGKFFIKKDLLKIYNLPENIYNEWEKFILLPSEVNNEKGSDKKKKETYTTQVSFDINKADTLELEKIKGIGKKLSIRIIKYKDKLGGFISEDQYAEIFGLDSGIVNKLRKATYIEKDFVPEKVNINTATFSGLSSHPYIGKKNASVIINYRNQHGPFQFLESLKTIRTIDDQQLNKMIPYLTL
jgi:competence protein ComEA